MTIKYTEKKISHTGWV